MTILPISVDSLAAAFVSFCASWLLRIPSNACWLVRYLFEFRLDVVESLRRAFRRDLRFGSCHLERVAYGIEVWDIVDLVDEG
jgi:hypothetical protein